MSNFIDFVFHIDQHLVNLVHTFGGWSYLIMFGIIFLETGVVIMPFLPGDSLLFAASALAVNPVYHLNEWLVFLIFLFACVLGDSSNFFIGRDAEKILVKHHLFKKLISDKNLNKGKSFFNKYGSGSIVLARFVPIARTFVPFIAAGSGYSYKKFLIRNIFGCCLWVIVCCGAGHFWGNIPFVKEHFSLVILLIIFVSVLPAVITVIFNKIRHKN